jgi:predicted transglutaminase-like protease
MTIDEMRLIYDESKTISEAAVKIGIAEYKLSRIRVDLKWPIKKMTIKRPPKDRLCSKSIYDSVLTSYDGRICNV